MRTAASRSKVGVVHSPCDQPVEGGGDGLDPLGDLALFEAGAVCPETGVRCAALACGDVRCGERPFGQMIGERQANSGSYRLT